MTCKKCNEPDSLHSYGLCPCQILAAARKIISSMKTPAKAAASRVNGKKGGRPVSCVGWSSDQWQAAYSELVSRGDLLPFEAVRQLSEKLPVGLGAVLVFNHRKSICNAYTARPLSEAISLLSYLPTGASSVLIEGLRAKGVSSRSGVLSGLGGGVVLL